MRAMRYTDGTRFADLANPISTHIYRQIGYHLVCDVQQIKFFD
jgi:predicted GNAT family acetyltransferase